MLGFVQSWFAPVSNPIGVDFGTDCLRLVQVEVTDNEHRIVAAASADVPTSVRADAAARCAFFTETVRELIARGNFRGRRVMLGLPSASMFIQHLRMPKLEEEAMKKALLWEARGKFPFDPSQALLRHLVAGEVYQDQEQKQEVVVMAARRDAVEQLLGATNRAKLEIAGMNVEPKALVDCFSHIYRRKTDMAAILCFADIGSSATRVVIARGSHILFARVIPVGGEHFSRAVSTGLKISLQDARLIRIKLAHAQAAQLVSGEQPQKQTAPTPTIEAASEIASRIEAPPEDESFALLGVSLAAAKQREGKSESPAGAAVAAAPRPVAPAQVPLDPAQAASDRERQLVEESYREPVARLVEELALCRRYHEATFPNMPVERLVFVGGEARHRGLCQQIARGMGVAAQVGDPLVRMGRLSEIGIETGIDRRLPQPAWAVALGLSMGTAGMTPEAGPQKEAK